MQIEILTPEKKLFSGDVYGVQLPGVNGSFEVLEKHAPLVSALGVGSLKVLLDKSGRQQSYSISGGFIEVIDNKVTVLLESANAS
jgi:F-type H+-transporting ATPase subunit epsilon